MNLVWIQIALASQSTMKYSRQITCIIILIATLGSCWEFYPAMTDFIFKDAMADSQPAQLEFVYGKCKPRDIVYTRIQVSSDDIDGRILVTGWLNITRTPKCIVIRGTAVDSDVDVYKSTAYSFQLCVPEINFLHSQRRWRYFFYEWYIPHDVVSGINWEIYFLGPDKMQWV